MRLGMLHLFENPIGVSERDIVKQQMELMIEAESLGFDSVWPAEHHFSEYGFCGSPQVTLAAVAARTSRIRLGTGVVVLPFHNPIRVAEDFAFLDLLSDGRVDFGIGRGYQPREYRGFGLDQEQSRERFAESIEIIRRCWTEERVTFEGRHFQITDLEVRPKPVQQPHPPVYMACISPVSYEIAGRHGFNVLTSSAFGQTEEGTRQGIASYRKARTEAGLDPHGGQIACLVMCYPAQTTEQARKEFRDPVTWYYRTISKYLAPPAGEAPVKGYEDYAKSRDLAARLEFDDLIDGPLMVCGDVAYCTEKLTRLAGEYQFNELLVWTRLGGLENRKVLRAMELMSGDVLPGVRKAREATVMAGA